MNSSITAFTCTKEAVSNISNSQRDYISKDWFDDFYELVEDSNVRDTKERRRVLKRLVLL